MTELILNLLDENIEWREEAAKAMEIVLKEAGGFPDQIRQLLQVCSLDKDGLPHAVSSSGTKECSGENTKSRLRLNCPKS